MAAVMSSKAMVCLGELNEDAVLEALALEAPALCCSRRDDRKSRAHTVAWEYFDVVPLSAWKSTHKQQGSTDRQHQDLGQKDYV